MNIYKLVQKVSLGNTSVISDHIETVAYIADKNTLLTHR